MNVVQLPQKDVSSALDVIDDLRAAVVAGRVVAFAAVAIEREDVLRTWSAATEPVSRLRMMGAIASLQHCYHAGDIE
jgi:hypothetical protein